MQIKTSMKKTTNLPTKPALYQEKTKIKKPPYSVKIFPNRMVARNPKTILESSSQKQQQKQTSKVV